MTYHPNSLLLDRSLDSLVNPVGIYVHDWMHGLFVDGVFNTVVYLLFEECIQSGMANVYETFEGYLAKWEWPGRISNMGHVAQIFSAQRKAKHREAKHIKCQASELMTVAGVLALFVQRVLLPAGVRNDACKAFLACADMVDFITHANRGRVTPELITASVHKFLAQFVAVWGEDWTVPKFHWLLHYSRVLRRFGMLFNCYVHERFHRIAKRYATDVKNYNRAIGGILREVTSHKLALLADTNAFNFEVGLVDPRPASARVCGTVQRLLGMDTTLAISTASVSRFSELAVCSVNDMALVKAGDSFKLGRIKVHVDIGGVAASVVSWHDVEHQFRGQGYSHWRATDHLEIIETGLILDTVPYTLMRNGIVGILHPCESR